MTRRLLPLAVLFNLLLLLYYVAVDYQVGLHADSAVMNLLAQEIRDTGSFFPASWYYANGDLWIAFTQLPILPLLSVLPNSFALHAWSSLVTAALVLSGAWCVGGMLGQSRNARLLLLLVLSSGISPNMAENLYGQAAYGVLFGFSCLLAFSGWRLMHADGAARWRWGACFALLALQVCWSNPQRALVFYVLPLLAALLAMRLPPAPAGPARRRGLLPALLLLAALLAGAALHGYVVRRVGSSGLAPATWLDFDGMLRNTLGTLRGVLSLLGGLPEAGARVISAGGAVAALRIAAALALLALLPWGLLRALNSPQHGPRRYFAVYTLSAAAVNLLVALTTSVPDMAAPEASVRYLAPSLLCALILLTGIAVDDFRWQRAGSVAALLALAVVGATGLQAYQVRGAPGYFPRGGVAAHNLYGQIARHLQQQGLRHGYSTFWNAGTITVLSGGQLQQRPVTLDNGLPMPVRHLTSSRWYQADGWQGETYLMLNYDEVKQVNWELLAGYVGQPTRVLDFAGCKIYVYPHNLAGAMPLWDLRRQVALRLRVDAATQHRIGRLLDGGGALQSAPGEAGHLRFGTIYTPPPGRYLVSFDLETGGSGVAEYGMVDVAVNGGADVLANLAITATGRQRLSMPVTLPRVNGGMEVRVLSNGAGSITLRDIELSATAPPPK
jgi:hypothetical protein